MLILFDIDRTLISTSGVGIASMLDAGRELFGPAFTVDGIPASGRLDPLLMSEMLEASGIPATVLNLAALRSAYARRLHDRLQAPGVGRALPGVHDLLRILLDAPGLTLGLLTGNFAETGRMKLAACGIDPDLFQVHVWGDDSPHHPPCRDHLPPIAISRYRERHGRILHGSLVTVIGDTPHDIACARAHGCRSLGVATGEFSPAELERAGADRVALDLSATGEIASWLVAPGGAALQTPGGLRAG